MAEIDHKKIASGLGAKVITLSELTKEESTSYVPLGSPVAIPSESIFSSEKPAFYYFGSQMLAQYGKSLEDAVGYRILDLDEEVEFRRECGNNSAMIVQYFRRKD